MLPTELLQESLLFLPRYMLDVVALVNRQTASIIAANAFKTTAPLRPFRLLTFPSATHMELFQGGQRYM